MKLTTGPNVIITITAILHAQMFLPYRIPCVKKKFRPKIREFALVTPAPGCNTTKKSENFLEKSENFLEKSKIGPIHFST